MPFEVKRHGIRGRRGDLLGLPADFQLVFDSLDTVDVANRFLRHLLLIEGADDPFDDHTAPIGFERQCPLSEERVLGHCLIDPLFQVGIIVNHGVSVGLDSR